MRQVEKMMLNAIESGHSFKCGNTEVRCFSFGTFVALHGNLIFALINGKRYYSNAGWNTATTASRLRALGANYSTNFKKCSCDLLSKNEMLDLYYSHMFTGA